MTTCTEWGLNNAWSVLEHASPSHALLKRNRSTLWLLVLLEFPLSVDHENGGRLVVVRGAPLKLSLTLLS